MKLVFMSIAILVLAIILPSPVVACYGYCHPSQGCIYGGLTGMDCYMIGTSCFERQATGCGDGLTTTLFASNYLRTDNEPPWGCDDNDCYNMWWYRCESRHNNCGAVCQEPGPPTRQCLRDCDQEYIDCVNNIDSICTCQA